MLITISLDAVVALATTVMFSTPVIPAVFAPVSLLSAVSVRVSDSVPPVMTVPASRSEALPTTFRVTFAAVLVTWSVLSSESPVIVTVAEPV